MEPVFIGTTKNGQIFFQNRKSFDDYIGNLGESIVKIIVKKYSQKRTSGQAHEKSNQNGYYWTCVIPILGNYFGYLNDEMHEAIKYKFLRKGGTDELPKIGSTTELSTKEWEDKMEEIRTWALTTYNINIPTVEDFYFYEETTN